MKNQALLAILGLSSLLINPLVFAKETTSQCNRGHLDAKFCDRNGDLVADPPSEVGDFIDPKVLIFAHTPVEDPAVYRSAWEGFLKHLQKVTGRRVQFFAVQSNAAQIEAMRAGRLHIAAFNAGSNPIAVNCAGYVPFAMMASADNSFGYEMEIITRPDSAIKSPKDLKGKTLAFSSPTSNSGCKAPQAILKDEFGLQVDRDYKPTFSGKHDNSILGVVNGDYEAAAVANSVLGRMRDRNVVQPSQYRSVYRSKTFPTSSFGYSHRLNPQLAKKIEEAFFTFDWTGSSLKEEYKKEDKFVPITYKRHWEVIRQIDTANQVAYKCQ